MGSLVKFVVGYCGMVAIHTHTNAAEWNTVINGEGTVPYFPVNGESLVTMHGKKGDTFVFPQGSAHWWVNYSPNEQLATVGGFTAPFPDTAPLADFLVKSKKVNNLLTDAVLGKTTNQPLSSTKWMGQKHSSHCSLHEALQLVVATRHAKVVRKLAPPASCLQRQLSFGKV